MASDERDSARGALGLLDEASSLLSRLEARAYVVYLLGTVPFQLLFVHFLARMSGHSAQSSALPIWAIGLTVAYCAMKACHALFCRELLAELEGREPPAKGGFARAWLQSAAWQPLGALLAIIAALLVLPLGWVVAFNRHGCVLAPRAEALGAWLRRVLSEARLWPRQNHWLLVLGASAYLVVALNGCVLLLVSPALLRSALGWDTRLAQGGFNPLNSSFLAVVGSVSYLLVDPVLHAAYTLRSHYARSRTRGDDLLARLRRWRRVALVATCLAIAGLPTAARAREPESATLDRALDHVLQQPEFAWHAQASPELAPSAGTLERALAGVQAFEQALGAALERFLEWLRPAPGPDDSTAVSGWSASLVWFVLALSVLVCGLLVLRLLRAKVAVPEPKRGAPAAALSPVLAAPAPSPSALPSGEWQGLAEQLLLRGERRLALRASFLAALALLHERGLVSAASHKSVADYARELSARAPARSELGLAFLAAAQLFERAWYGSASVDDAYLAEFKKRRERLVSGVVG